MWLLLMLPPRARLETQGAAISALALLCPSAEALPAPHGGTPVLPRYQESASAVEGVGGAVALAAPPPADLPPLPTEFPRLPDPELPSYETVVLPNGLRVLLLEDHELGIVTGQLLMKGGYRGEPAGRTGIAGIALGVQRAGGSVAHPADVLDARLEDLSASVELSAANGALQAGFDCLSEDLDEVFGLFAEVVMEPALPQSRLDLSRSRVLDAIEHRNDNGDAVAARKLRALLYGKDSLVSRDPSVESVTSITREDLAGYLATWERPDAAILGISGDFKTSEVKKLLRRDLASWAPAPGQPADPPSLPTPTGPYPEHDGAVYLVDIPGLTQSYVSMGELGVTLMDPDTYKLDVLNGVLNGFGGRLFNEVRSKGGLAYTVSGGWSPKLDYPGVFVAGGSTNQPARLITEVGKVLEGTVQAAPTEDEVSAAKDAALNRFVFNFADAQSQLARITSYDLFGLPQDLIFTYKAGIEAADAPGLLAVARDHMHVGRQAVVVVGDAARVRGQLDKAGFTVRDLPLDP